MWAGALLFFVAALGYGIHWVSYLPGLSIATVAVAGAEHISPEDVQAQVESALFSDTFSFFSKKNIFSYSRKNLEAMIREQFPRVQSVRISRDALLAQAITVTIEERKPYGRWCGEHLCFLLDAHGYIFAREDTPDASIRYTFRGAVFESDTLIGQTFLPEHFSEISMFLEQLEKGGFSPQVLTVEEDKDFSVQLARGYRVLASFGNDPISTLRNLELILSSDALRGKEGELEYVDLRFGNRVFYKFKGHIAQEQ